VVERLLATDGYFQPVDPLMNTSEFGVEVCFQVVNPFIKRIFQIVDPGVQVVHSGILVIHTGILEKQTHNNGKADQ
jgi:hypothetical protein